MSRPGLLIARHQFSADRRKINPVPGRGICAHRSHPSTAADRRHGLQRVLRATVAESRPPREHSATTPLLQPAQFLARPNVGPESRVVIGHSSVHNQSMAWNALQSVLRGTLASLFAIRMSCHSPPCIRRVSMVRKPF